MSTRFKTIFYSVILMLFILSTALNFSAGVLSTFSLSSKWWLLLLLPLGIIFGFLWCLVIQDALDYLLAPSKPNVKDATKD